MKIINMYQCERCNKESRVKETITKCEAEHVRIDESIEKAKKNQFRLTIGHPNELEQAIINYAKLYDLELSFTKLLDNPSWSGLEKIGTTHSAPIGHRTTNSSHKSIWHLGWKGWIEGTIKGKIKKRDVGFMDLCGRWSIECGLVPIEGLYTGTFNGGPEFSGELRLYLIDYPKMLKNYLAWIKIHKEDKKFLSSRAENIHNTIWEKNRVEREKEQQIVKTIEAKAW